jgi:hypothetical protein
MKESGLKMFLMEKASLLLRIKTFTKENGKMIRLVASGVSSQKI